MTDPTEGELQCPATVRLSLALLFALMMVIATASAALAFDPPENNNASGICGFDFPAFGIGVGTSGEPGGAAPWLATNAGPSPGSAGPGPLEFDASCA